MRLIKFLIPSLIFISGCGALNVTLDERSLEKVEVPQTIQLLPNAVPSKKDSYIIVFKNNANISNITANLNIRVKNRYKNVFKGISADLTPQAYIALQKNPNVAFIEKDGIAVALGQITPFGITRIQALRNFVSPTDVDVAIFDTGIDDHPDLNVVSRVDFTGSGSGDVHGHGTHVSGTVAALDNDIGVIGGAPGARLWEIKILSNSGSGQWSWIIAGMDWAIEHADEIDVGNMSIGGIGYLESVHLAVKRVAEAGIILVVAAGNSSRDIYGADKIPFTSDDFIPASFPEVATISAMTETDGEPGGFGPNSPRGMLDDGFTSAFSNYSDTVIVTNPVQSPGAAIDLAMPGDNVLSLRAGGDTRLASGTSMATPHATALFARYVAELGKPNNASDVYEFRQLAIDNAFAQAEWRLDGIIRDRDTKHEGLGNVDIGGVGGNFRPFVKILSPPQNIIYHFGDSIIFLATALDREEGDLSANLAWIRDSTELIGIGAEFIKEAGDFGVNSVVVEATVADSNGAIGFAFVKFSVRDSINHFPPVIDSLRDRHTREGLTASWLVTATDSDQTTPKLFAFNLPTEATFIDLGDGTARFSWLIDFDKAGEYEIPIIAIDEDDSTVYDSALMYILVTESKPSSQYWLSTRPSNIDDSAGHFSLEFRHLRHQHDTVTITIPAGDIGKEFTSYGYTPIGIPNNNDWETDSFQVFMKVIDCGGFTYIDMSVSRVDSLGNVLETSEKSIRGEQQCAPYRFAKSWYIPRMDWGRGNSGDRLRLNYHFTNKASVGGQRLRLLTGTDFSVFRTFISIDNNTSCCVLAGDANSDGRTNIADVTFIIAMIYAHGKQPECFDQADANADGKINIADVTYIIDRIFHKGPAPICRNVEN